MLKKILIVAALVGLWLASSYVLFLPEFFRIHDYVHGARIGEMAQALTDGQFPVRWSSNFGYGYGMPLFEFYAPLPYYLGAVLFIFGFELLLVLKLLFAIVTAGTVIGSYLLGKELFGRAGGLITATLITLAPYRAVNLYVRGALSEAWGMMALPWILLGLILVIKGKRGGSLLLTLSLVVMMLSHNLTTLLFIPLNIVFALGFSAVLVLSHNLPRSEKIKQWLKTNLKIGGAYLLATGLSAFYLFPAYGEKDFTQINTIVGGYFDYTLHFLYMRQFVTPGWSYGGSNWGPDDGISFFLGFGQLLGLVLLVIVLGKWVQRVWLQRLSLTRTPHFSLLLLLGLVVLLAAVSIGMSVGRSQPLWDMVPFLAFVQFPWRWLSPAVVFLSLAVAMATKFLRSTSQRILMAVVIFGVTGLGNTYMFQPEGFLDTAESLYYVDPYRIQTHMSGVLQDYIPVQMSPEIKLNPQGQPRVITNLGVDEYEVLVNRSQEKLLLTKFSQPTTMELAIADFPGWYAELDGQPLNHTQNAVGAIQLQIPSGEHRVGIVFGSTPLRAASDTVSAVSLIVLLFLFIKPRLLSHD